MSIPYSREPDPFLFLSGWEKGSSIFLFVLPDPQILRMLIGVDGVERLINKV